MKQIIASVILILVCGGVASSAQENPCPQIKIIAPQSLINAGETAQLNVEINKEIEKYKPEYLWTVSRGKITRGQGTPEIEVATSLEDHDFNITATVKLKGLPENCADYGSETFAIMRISDHRWFDMFGKLPKNDVYARLDNYFVAIINDPTAEGVIILEFDKTETRAKKIKRLKEVLAHINYRKFPKSRLKFFLSDADEEYTRLFIIPQGRKISDIRDDTDSYELLQGEEIEQKIKELFPLKKKQL